MFLQCGQGVESRDYDVDDANEANAAEREVVDVECGCAIFFPLESAVAQQVKGQRKTAHNHLQQQKRLT